MTNIVYYKNLQSLQNSDKKHSICSYHPGFISVLEFATETRVCIMIPVRVLMVDFTGWMEFLFI